MIDFTEGDYVLGLWFLAGKNPNPGGGGADWMGVVSKAKDEVCLQFRYRFRYYATSTGVFDGRDTKNEYHASLDGKTEDQAIAIVDGVLDDLVRDGFCGTKLPWKVRELRHKVIVRGDHKAFYRAIVGLPFVHTTKASEHS